MSSLNNPLLTIVTVCYNAVDEIEKTILSVINQTYENIEYIIVDGASTDGTLNVINKYRDFISCCISEPDGGIYEAMNKGIKLATGEWINFMNAGDTFSSVDILSRLFMQSGSQLREYAIIYGDCIACISLCERYSKVTNPFWNNKSLVHGKGFSHQSTFVRVDVIKENPFDLKYKICSDFNMMYLLYQQNYKFLYQDVAISKYEVENGISKKNKNLVFKENAMILGSYGTFAFRLYYIIFNIRSLFHSLVSQLVMKFSPSLFNYIKIKRLK